MPKKIDNSIQYEELNKEITLIVLDKYFAPYGVFEILKDYYSDPQKLNEIKIDLSKIFNDIKNSSHADWKIQKIIINDKKIIF